ncbi:MAG: hypothetical protein LBH04_07780 [Tannerellaceae bacterium]|jgi:hypothetical protein|nr:hypothetical protein [Tannerellaceae bacterium]
MDRYNNVPAGKDLYSMITIRYASAQEAFDTSFERGSNNSIKAGNIYNDLADFNGINHPLLGQGFGFTFNEPPTIREEFDLTFTAYKHEDTFFTKVVRINYY